MTRISVIDQLFSTLKEIIISNYKVILVFSIIIRGVTSFLYGTQDVEWWKAWYKSIDEKGITNIYGEDDITNIFLLKNGLTIKEVREKTQNHIKFIPQDYERNDYVVTQPPVYLYHLYISGAVYKYIDPLLSNNRVYNSILNLIPIIYTLLTSLVLYRFLLTTKHSAIAAHTSLLFLINPLILLNSPIQGFWDPILGFYVILSLIALYRSNLNLSVLWFVVAVLVKPTAIIILPVFVFSIIRDFKFYKLLIALIFSICVLGILCFPYILNGRVLSMVIGIHSILESSNDISRQALNFWWPVQYLSNYYFSALNDFWDFAKGSNFVWYQDFPISKIKVIDLRIISTVLYLSFTLINLINFSKTVKSERLNILYFCFLQCYIYFMLRIGVQNNHYYIMVILYSIFAFMSRELLFNFLIIISLFLFQDFLFYGFGRDFSYMIPVINYFNLPLITIVIAIINFLFFLKLVTKPTKLV
jgi:hypothetical protein